MERHTVGVSLTLGVLLAIGVLARPALAPAQQLLPGGDAEEVSSNGPRTFGTASEVARVISAVDMQVIQGTGSVLSSAWQGTCPAGPCVFLGGGPPSGRGAGEPHRAAGV